MDAPDRVRIPTSRSTATGWLQRVLLSVLGVLVLVTAFFFLTVALIAGAFLAVIIGVRWWWLVRRLRAREAASGPLEGHYTVVQEPGTSDRQRER